MIALFLAIVMMTGILPVSASQDATITIPAGEFMQVLDVGETIRIPVNKNNFQEDDVITWAITSGSDCISLDQEGNVTGLAYGHADVSASLENGSSVSFMVTVCPPVESIQIVAPFITAIAGRDPQYIEVSIEPHEATPRVQRLQYETADPSIAKCEGNYLTPLSEGNTTLTVTADNGVSATVEVYVKAEGDYADYIDSDWDSPLAKDHNIYAEIGETVEIAPVLKSNSNPDQTEFADEHVYYSIPSGSEYATVEQDGNNLKVTGIKTGRISIRAQLTCGSYAFFWVQVAPKIESLSFNPDKIYTIPYVQWKGFNIKDYLITEPADAIYRQYSLSVEGSALGGVFTPGLTYVNVNSVGTATVTVTPTDDPSLAVSHEFVIAEPAEMEAPESVEAISNTEITKYQNYIYAEVNKDNQADLMVQYTPEGRKTDTEWKSSDEEIATVRELNYGPAGAKQAAVLHHKTGSCVITATPKYNPFISQSFNVNVIEGDPVEITFKTELTMNEEEAPEELILEEGVEYALNIRQSGNMIPSYVKVEEYFENLSVIKDLTVRPETLLSAYSNVTQVLTAFFKAGKPGEEILTIGDKTIKLIVEQKEEPGIKRIWFTSDSYEMKAGGQMVLIAHTDPEDLEEPLTFTSSDPEIVSLEGNLLHALKVGTATITVTAQNGVSGSVEINVVEDEHSYSEPVYTWADDNSKVTAEAVCQYCGNKITETVETTYEVIKEATLEETGTGKYTAVFTNEMFETQTKEVEIPALSDHSAQSITLDQTEVSTTVKEPVQLKATVLPEDCEDQTVTWTSSDMSVAEVDQNGLVTGKKPGTAVITAKTVNGLTAECNIRILFTDVADSTRYYFNPVYWCVDRNITVGYGGVDLFSPDYPVTRGQFVTFLYRLAGEPEVTETAGFDDVDPAKFYAKPIAWAAANGITTGYFGRNEFGPDDKCTREQIVTFLWRYAKSPTPEKTTEFTDSRPNAYYLDALSWAAEEEITVGLNDGTGRFGVGQDCTRGMTVTFLYRFENN